ncbi:MAG TPA: RNase H family protein [Acidimicrobiales bacterium]|nr:RNase H family protein [Acidimicrobiales bacterium]
MTTEVYTDGACLGNPGPGGWAWAVPGGRYASGAAAATTNQRMEIQAALEAVTSNPGPLVIVSDSTYVVNCFRDRWWEGWLARGWMNKAKKPVANRDLWEPLIQAVRADPARVTFRWVKGHGADPFNDLVDRLAVEAARTQVGRSGEDPPTALGPADAPGAGDPRRPEGHLVAVIGHKPPELGGYDDNPVAAGVRAKLAELLAAKAQLHPDLVVLTGLGLGAEQLAAEAATEAGVPYVAVLPYPDPDLVWPAESRRHFADLASKARGTVVLQSKAPATKQLAGAALRRRDAWLAREADEAVAVWDGDDAGVGRAVRALQDSLGEEDVWVLAPPR